MTEADDQAASVTPEAAPDGIAPASPRPRSAAWRGLLLGTALLAATAMAAWWALGRNQAAKAPAVVADSGPQVAADAELSAELGVLQRRLDDAARVNRALREQVLGLTQRVGLLEEGVAAVERGGAPGMDALRLAEADFLLQLAEQRMRLYGDIEGARLALGLADAQLAEVADPGVTSVRQTLALERDALAAAALPDLPLLLARIERLAESVVSWSLARKTDDAGEEAAQTGWWRRLLGAVDRYFRVRRVDPAERSLGGPLLRETLALEFSSARLLLLRGEQALAMQSLGRARTRIAEHFDLGEAGPRQALVMLDEWLAAPWNRPPPRLGEARRELARLRGVGWRDSDRRDEAAIEPVDAPPQADTAPVGDGEMRPESDED